MEDNFSWFRLRALLCHFWVEKRKNLIFPVLILVLFFVGFNYMTIGDVRGPKPEFMSVLLALFAKWTLLAMLIYHIHLAFAKGAGGVKSQLLHLLPASPKEKYIYLMLTSFVIPFVFYMSVFELINTIFVHTTTAHPFSFIQLLFPEMELWNNMKFGQIMLPYMLMNVLLLYLMFHMLVLGQLVFKNYAVLKVLGIFYVATNFLSLVVLNLFNPDFFGRFVKSIQEYATNNPAGLIQLSWTVFVPAFILLTGLFYVNWLRFKKKEIKA